MAYELLSIRAAELLTHGPLVLLWNQCEHIDPDVELPFPAKAEIPWRARFFGPKHRPWKLSIRITPAPGADLGVFGGRIAETLGSPLTRAPRDEDHAVWLACVEFERYAADALLSAQRILARLTDLDIGSAQIRVERWG